MDRSCDLGKSTRGINAGRDIHGHHPTQFPENPNNPKSIPGKPEQPKVYARNPRKTQSICQENLENSGKPKQPKVNLGFLEFSGIFRFSGVVQVFRIFLVVWVIWVF